LFCFDFIITVLNGQFNNQFVVYCSTQRLLNEDITGTKDVFVIINFSKNHSWHREETYIKRYRTLACCIFDFKITEEFDTLDPDDRHYIKRKADLDDRLYKMYDKIEDTEICLDNGAHVECTVKLIKSSKE